MKKYKKLCKSTTFAGKRSRLLVCDDHLLLVGNILGAEEYRRFFLKDLRFITIFKTSLGWIMNVVLSVFLFITGMISIFSLFFYKSNNEDALLGISIFFAIIAVIL